MSDLPHGSGKESDIASALRFSTLPKLNMQTFDGNPLYYHQFVRSFDSLFKLIDDPESKLRYLIQCCPGRAYKVVEPCVKIQSVDRAYSVAREKLEKFGRRQYIIDAHLALIADSPNIRADDVTGLDQLAINMESCYRTLCEWHSETRLDSPETLLKILDRLPIKM